MKTTSTILLTALALDALPPCSQRPGTTTTAAAIAAATAPFNPEEFRQRMNERLKTSLKVSDEEWSVLQPLIEKVQTKQRDACGGRFGGFGGGGGGGGGGDAAARRSAVAATARPIVPAPRKARRCAPRSKTRAPRPRR